MPVVPVEQNRVGIADPVVARYKSPDLSGTGLEALGRGLQALGGGVADYGVAQDQIQDHADRIYARNSDVTAAAQIDELVGQYKVLRGKDATDQGADFDGRIDALVEQTLLGAGNARSRAYLDPMLKARAAEAKGRIADHSRTEQFAFAGDTYRSGSALAANQAAAAWDDPEKQAEYIAQGRDSLARLGVLEGWHGSPEQVAAHDIDFTTKIHSGAVDAILARPDGGVDLAQAYIEKNKGEMTYAAQIEAAEKLKGPLQERRSASIFEEATSGLVPGAASDPYSKYPLVPASGRGAWDKRADGSEKGLGWLGLRQRPDGGVSSEISAGITIDGKEVEVPLMVPGLTGKELDYLMTHDPDLEKNPRFFEDMPKSILDKAESFAKGRLAEGKSPFRQDGEPAAQTPGGGGKTTIAPGTYKSPVEGGRITNSFAQHVARGSAGLDIAVREGSAIHPIAGGEVIDVGFDPKRAGNFVIVRHPDGRTSSYSHMGNVSVKKGDPVAAGAVLGTVGMTGHTTGPHVHLRVRDAAGNDIDPETILGRASAGGQVAGSSSSPRNWDQAAVIANIDKRTDLTPEEREAAKVYARRRMGQDEAVLEDGYRDAADSYRKWVSDYATGHNGEFPPASAVPRDISNRMKPSDWAAERASLQDAARKRAEAAARIPDNTADAVKLQILQRTDPTAFADLKLEKYVGKISPNQLHGFLLAQASITGSENKPEPYNPRSGIKAAIEWGGKYGGVAIDDRDFPAVYDTMDSYLRGIYQKKGKVEQSDYDAAFAAATRDVRARWSFFNGETTMKAYERTLHTLPDETRAVIVRNFKAAPSNRDHRDPTDAEILAIYRGM